MPEARTAASCSALDFLSEESLGQSQQLVELPVSHSVQCGRTPLGEGPRGSLTDSLLGASTAASQS